MQSVRVRIRTVGFTHALKVFARLAVWLLFMASGLLVIPLSIAMCIAFFPAGVPIFLMWLDWLEGTHDWALGGTDSIDPVQAGRRRSGS
jgi:hypothetical protein